MNERNPRPRQRGAVLIVTLVLLTALTILAVTTTRNSSMELGMAQNHQFKIDAFQEAQSAQDFLFERFIDDPDTLPVTNTVDSEVCIGTGTAVVGGPCSGVTPSFSLPSFLQGDNADKSVALTVRRIAPEKGLPPVVTKTSLDRFWAAFFEAEAVTDAGALGQGKGAIGTGILRLVHKDPAIYEE